MALDVAEEFALVPAALRARAAQGGLRHERRVVGAERRAREHIGPPEA